ncbi:MAG: hypothetical protein WCJ14_11895 [Verrucomicrobiota bacterium]
MSRHTPSREEVELTRLRQREDLLRQQEKESSANRERLVKERSERERTMPPLDEVQDRARRILHEQSVSRGEVGNILRTQNRDLLLIFLLLAATCALVWWGLQLMRG